MTTTALEGDELSFQDSPQGDLVKCASTDVSLCVVQVVSINTYMEPKEYICRNAFLFEYTKAAS